MRNWKKSARQLAVALAVVLFGAAGASAQLTNGGFESPDASGGDVPCTAGWSCFNDVFTSASSAPARTGNQVLKVFGPFGGPGGGAGATQSLPALPGQTWVGEIYAMNFSADSIQGADFGVFKIEFRNAAGNLAAGGVLGVDVFESNVINASTPLDTWTLLGVGTAPAPVGTVSAQAVIVKVAIDGFNGGSIFWDDARLFVDGSVSNEDSSFGAIKALF